jgi:hypothetical protein
MTWWYFWPLDVAASRAGNDAGEPDAQMDDKTRKANKKLADLRRKEEEFIQKMMEAEER